MPSSFAIGWSPVSRSMIDSLRAARRAGPCMTSPDESGPRCTSVALIASSRSRSGALRSATIPQIPHMRENSTRAYRHGVELHSHELWQLLGLLVVVGALLVLAPVPRIPYPILLVLGGLALG